MWGAVRIVTACVVIVLCGSAALLQRRRPLSLSVAPSSAPLSLSPSPSLSPSLSALGSAVLEAVFEPGRGRPNAVLGMAAVQPADAARFARSFREWNARDDLFFFVTTPADAASFANLSAAYNVSVVLVADAALPPHMKGSSPSNYRWHIMRSFLASLSPSRYNLILMSDVRDVVFQRNVFAAFEHFMTGRQGPVFFAIQESRAMTIGKCWVNKQWVASCHGHALLARISHERISCSGTSVATQEAALRYTKLMDETFRSRFQAGACREHGSDQGIHNGLVYGGMLDAAGVTVVKVDNEYGPIATLGYMSTFNLSPVDKELLNMNEEPYAMIHQLDRQTHILKRWKDAWPQRKAV